MWFHCYDIFLHDFDVDVVIEVNDVFLLSIAVVYVHVYVKCAPLVLKHLGVFANDVVELNLQAGLHFTNAIDGTHNHLVKHSVDQEMWLSGKLYFHDSPDLFDDLFFKFEALTEFHHFLS